MYSTNNETTVKRNRLHTLHPYEVICELFEYPVANWDRLSFFGIKVEINNVHLILDKHGLLSDLSSLFLGGSGVKIGGRKVDCRKYIRTANKTKMNLDTIEILTKELKATKDFYKNVLQLPVTECDHKSISIKIGLSTLKFVESLEKDKPIYHFAFNIPENKLSEAIEWCANRIELIKKEEAVLITEFEAWNANAVYFYDNNGNILEFIARKELDNSETKTFSSKHLLNISEIGIVMDHPLEFGNQLIQNYGLNLFEKNHISELFTAIGDDNGLLIIVKTNRNWYPTDTAAKSNWTKIELSNKNQSHIIEIKESSSR